MILNFQTTPADPTDYLPNPPKSKSQATTSMGEIATILDFIDSCGYTFEPWQVATFVTALRTKPFLILAGISGTGKTHLPRLVAHATGAEAIIVPVKPDWTDSSDLLGYERLDGGFTPGTLLKVADLAISRPETQFFFVLDEMNIARVEYYFAEVLSVLESRTRSSSGEIISAPPSLSGWL